MFRLQEMLKFKYTHTLFRASHGSREQGWVALRFLRSHRWCDQALGALPCLSSRQGISHGSDDPGIVCRQASIYLLVVNPRVHIILFRELIIRM